MKNKTIVSAILFLFFALAISLAQGAVPLPQRQALVLAVEGKAEYSEDGKPFKKLKASQVLKEGAVIRTGGNGRVDLFFRRIGTTLRLVGHTELALEKLAIGWQNDVVVKDTLLDLRKGRLFCFVRVLVADSQFAIKTKIATTMMDGSGTGRYEIRADGTFVTGKSSHNKLKVINEDGIYYIAPGQLYNAKKKKMLPLAPSDLELSVLQFDELQGLAEQLTPAPAPEELPKSKR